MNELQKIYFESKNRLREAGIDNPAFDAAKILEKHSGVRREEFILSDTLPEKFNKDAFFKDLARREAREPLQYILKVWPFYGFDFYVGKGVLIPRQDTEILAKTSIDYLNSKGGNKKFLELCGGSGCISTAIAKSCENTSGVCVELSDDALFYLNKNLKLNEVQDRVKVIKADILKESTPNLCGKGFDLILSNPPYIKSEDIKGLEPEVEKFEPKMALDGGKDGLLFYRAMKPYVNLLKSGGMMAFEIGIGEAADVCALLSSFGLENIFITRDFSGIERVVGGYKSERP